MVKKEHMQLQQPQSSTALFGSMPGLASSGLPAAPYCKPESKESAVMAAAAASEASGGCALSTASALAAASLPPPQPGTPPLLQSYNSTVTPSLLARLPTLDAVRMLRSTTSTSACGSYCPSTSALLAVPIIQQQQQRPAVTAEDNTTWQQLLLGSVHGSIPGIGMGSLAGMRMFA